MNMMTNIPLWLLDIPFDRLLDYMGAFAFCLGGASVALRQKMDPFGLFMLAVINGFGGGMLRDVLLGNTPPMVCRTLTYWIIALAATLIIYVPSLFMSQKLQWRVSKRVWFFFDAFGLAFYTVVGIKAGLSKSLHAYQCIMMGVSTACFGGVLRDIIINRVPSLFHEDIYALLSLAGGVMFFLLPHSVGTPYRGIITVAFIFLLRWIVVMKGLSFPKSRHVPE